MVHIKYVLAAGMLSLASVASAHPGHDVKAEAAERAVFLKNAGVHSRGLAQCASKLNARGLENKNFVRRQQAVKHIRHRRGLKTGTFEHKFHSVS